MANTKRISKLPTEDQATAPKAPIVAAPIAPQVAGVRGGSPVTLGGDPGFDPNYQAIAPYQSINSMPNAVSSLRTAWGATGTPNAVQRTVNRAVTQTDPGVVARSLQSHWQGASSGGGQVPLPTPAAMSIPDAQKYLGDLTREMKANFDAHLQAMSPDEVARSRFWRAYQSMPEPVATLAARRWWTNSMTGTGPVADWMKWMRG